MGRWVTYTAVDKGYGAIQVLLLRNVIADQRYEGIWFNVIGVTMAWEVSNFQEKKRYVTLEWPHID